MATPQSVAFHTLGCKLNYSETSTIKRRFEEYGFCSVPWEQAADIYVINTCSVTEFADKKCRAAVRGALSRQPQAKIVVIGCYAQLKPDEISDIPGVDLVLGAAEKFRVASYVENLTKASGKGLVNAGDIKEVNSFEHAFSFGDRTRTFLKVQDGCDYKCSFCTIPMARGKSRSSGIHEILEQANKIAASGVKEIVLTGVNIGDFRDPSSRNMTFIDLIRELDQIEGIQRFRISSIEPNLCSEEIIKFVARSKRFVPHFHMPLQSGSDHILRDMRRRYGVSLYRDKVQLIKEYMPHCCIGVDVIVGYPGESEEHFQTTHEFIDDLDISYLHVFTYSDRTGTVASSKNSKVPMQVRRMRNARLRTLSDLKKHQFYQKHLNSERTVLFENINDLNTTTGFTDNYIKVQVDTGLDDIRNTIETVQLCEILPNGNVRAKLTSQFSDTGIPDQINALTQ